MRHLAIRLFLLVLIVPGSIALADAPSAHPPVVIELYVGSFTANVGGPISLGREIDVRMTGSSGDRAQFTIPNVIENVKMPEVSPGVYAGHYTVVKGSDVDNTAILGELISKDGTMAPVMSAAERVSIDTMSPKLVNRTPADGDRIIGSRPVFYCGFDDGGGGTGVNPDSVQIRVDGYDITAKADVSSYGVSYQPKTPLPVGDHTVFVRAADLAGNSVQDIWHFTIAAPSETDITSLTGSTESPLLAGDTLSVTLAAAPGGKAEFQIPPLGEICAMTEVEPGRYEGKFIAHAGDSLNGAPLVLHLTVGTQVYTAIWDHRVSIRAGAPPKPTITQPSEDDISQGGIRMAGRAPANSLVLCTISYRGSSEGGLKPFSGTAATVAARADARGIWRVGQINLKLKALFAKNLDTRIDLTAVTQDGTGAESEPSTQRIAYYP